MSKTRLVNLVFILLLALACAAGLEFLNVSPNSGALAIRGHNVSFSGLVSLFFILVCSLNLILAFSKNVVVGIRHEPSFAITILIFSSLIFFHVTQFDADYLITVENFFLFTLFALALFYREKKTALDAFYKYGLIVFGIAYTVSIVLPFLIPLKNCNIFGFYDLTAPMRFKGWFGSPIVIGFLGLSLAMGSLIKIFQEREAKISWLHLFFAWIGIWGIYFSVHRTTMLAITAVLIFFIVQALRKNDLSRVPMCCFMLICCVFFQFTGIMAAKTGFNVSKAIANKDINQVVQTNGRWDVMKTIWRVTLEHPLGQGTGGTPRYIDRHKLFFAKQPHNDYLRVLGDQGFAGFFLFLLVCAWLLYRTRNSLSFACVLAFGICLLTDNLMVLPAYGLGPIFLMSLLAKDEGRK